ncbi:NAD-dependent epimerase/dehydratase family protein [Patescibacteria group bacterium]|nr:NAD-dependent epimerase/dehydratase family protein [Patescibacteria group bacterium]
MKALVTGGAGFIGSNLTTYLCDHGYKVDVIDDSSSNNRTTIDKRANLINDSIANVALLEELLDGKDVVFHLAATGIIELSIKNPPAYFENNLMNGIKLLDAMRKKGVKKIVYSSSSGVYGEPKRVPIREDDVKEPFNPYGATKYAFEHVLSSYYHSFGIESVSLRYYNVYGPGDEQSPVTRAVPKWIKAALKDDPLTLYWGGKQKKDYVFVEDVARANLLSAERGKGCSFYNVGSGYGCWMYDLAKILEEVFGKKLNIQQAGERAGDPTFLIADISRIKKELGWEPKIDLKAGLARTIEYYRDNY